MYSNIDKRHYDEPVREAQKAGEARTIMGRYAFLAVMCGRAVAPGMVVGRAVLVTGREDMARVKKGAVVISKIASPDLVMVMPRARAVVMEYGGQGTVASWLARKYGIPAVAGIAELTRIVKDGDLVRVNGTKGTVEILEVIILQGERGGTSEHGG